MSILCSSLDGLEACEGYTSNKSCVECSKAHPVYKIYPFQTFDLVWGEGAANPPRISEKSSQQHPLFNFCLLFG